MSRSIEELKAELDQVMTELHEVAEKQATLSTRREELTDEISAMTVASFSPEVVEKAQGLGINPNNYDSEDALKEAIQIVNTNKENQ